MGVAKGRLVTELRFAARELGVRSPGDAGAGLGVLLVPGFGCGDWTLALTRKWLRRRGYRPARAHIGLNVGCTTEMVDRVEQRAEQHARATGGPIVLLGQSRGGWLARLLASRRPELVRALVTAGSPVLDPLSANPRVIRHARMLTKLSAMGLPGLLDDECFSGDCYEENVRALASPLPRGMPALAVYSRADRVAPWKSCLDPSAECVEIASSHFDMALTPAFYAVLEPRLAAWSAVHESVHHNSSR
ncbi:alpha/beta hydrolase [Amycolatopsis magusensis]|uniref:Pimeloyl-ACP methyl ester carboxylesterase n=1 Tax=Amycolatopsis magusensis TaxID=882444 RepID=A0ABS4PXQ5_9PSEU|nr:alpha/beta hydrolase [Amycolatopsis magusensis]MBP2184217.1 pimeloyl-ACP methyl ester carboxylesterase [Amycolatopsis magusensis]